ncbi:MAG: thiolase family protein [Clostridiales bacterium]|jgi:acetyl-CoA C-acetyltransferase|nr:thiolase family protein [Clostridiales bacterium]
MFKDVVVVSQARTAVGGFGGSLKDFNSIDLAVIVIKEAIKRAGIDPKEIDEVVMGCVAQHGLNAFLSRIAALRAGCSIESSALNVNRLCSSGLQAIVTAATSIDHGDYDVAVAGGTESMSNIPYAIYNARWGLRMGNSVLSDELTAALSEPIAGNGTHIAITAENVSERYGISRQRLDEYSLESQNRALNAIKEGKFKEEIVPIEIKTKNEVRIFDTDEHPRETTIEKLAKLRAFAKADGIVTAGNASGVNDGAAALVLMTSKKADDLGCRPLVRVVDYAVAGVDPNYMGMGPVYSTKKLLEKTGLAIEDIGLVELNEAFAAQAIACIDELGFDYSIVNVNGSGISLGHPIGATGAIISIKLINEMRRRNVRYGLATLCIGGGQGLSVLYELM